jgi:nicotinate-nucleotide pyrophosphorylase (carboxylating)
MQRILGRFEAPAPSREIVDALVRAALKEDAAAEDRAAAALPNDMRALGRVVAKEPGVLAGSFVFRRVFEILSQAHEEIHGELRRGTEIPVEHGRSVEQVERFEHGGKRDGDTFSAGDVVLTTLGSGRTLLSGERTALNFLQRLSGIATTTRAFVDAAAGRIAITDTRKTTPGLRTLEKYAVGVGGGVSHRPNLREMAMLKENHIALAGGIRAAVESLRAASRSVPLTVEVRTLEEAREAAALGVDRILLDNMSPAEIRRVVQALGPRHSRPELEASGGIRLENIDELAQTGIDVASIGALTHSVRAIDFSFLVERASRES